MLDIAFIRQNPETVKKAAHDKGFKTDIDRLLVLDRDISSLRREADALREKKNANASVSAADPSYRETAAKTARDIKTALSGITARLAPLQDEFDRLMLSVPSVPAADVPPGKSEDDNIELRRVGEVRDFGFTPRSHIELAELHDMIEIPRAVKIAGSRSYYLKNDGLVLELAVCRFALDFLTGCGFTPMSVPYLVNEDAMRGTGYFPGGYDQAYKLPEDGLFLIGTSEVALVSYYSGEVFKSGKLPVRLAGYSDCFRREAGTYGKDTRGLYRVHQFKKVEQVIICENDEWQIRALHDEILSNTETILQALELPYRVCLACAGEIGIGQVRKHEVETWMPERGAYCETHSCSTMGDFQARRLNIRYRSDGELKYACTLNNTGIASPRILIPLLENHQNADGDINIPAALRPYMNGRSVIKAPK